MLPLPIACVIVFCSSVLAASSKPHIIVIVADDLGWNDVSFHGSDQIPTPNIDALAYNGVVLNNHYVQPLCTPSRAAFLTGKYPIHTGMQHLVILESEPWGLGLEEKILPQRLKDHGYTTHAIGKWHLGFFKKEYTPTFRGFDSHYGYWQGLQDYYTHMAHGTLTEELGYDFRRDMEIDWSARGKYSTNLFTDEAVNLIHRHNTSKPMFMYLAHLAVHSGNADNLVQAPDEEVAKFSNIDDPQRRVYAAMMSMMDQSVGKVVTALRQKEMLENSIIIFFSDNGAVTKGAHHPNFGSNYPLRGLKNSPWEGATRCVAAVWSPLIKKPQRVDTHVMHVTDWVPTIYSAIGLNLTELRDVDGHDMWKTISEDADSSRTDLLYNIDPVVNYAAIRRGDWKYIDGTTPAKEDLWYGSSGKDKEYGYDQRLVLNSETAVAIAGVITSMQIKEKELLGKATNKSDFSKQLLKLETISELRKSATVTCPELNPEELHDNTKCKPLESPCLFNVKDDPCEMVNLAKTRPMILMNLEEQLMRVKKTMINIRNTPRDLLADPLNWNDTWIPWQDDEEVKKFKLSLQTPQSSIAVILIGSACAAFVLTLTGIIIHSVRKSNVLKKQSRSANETDKIPSKSMREIEEQRSDEED
uniref:Sulfatase N-terminal domain-containing protein n=1 Tax=Photinus pyralis TaxID=7054 RepID=A0A1Y1K5U7_PHOPY